MRAVDVPGARGHLAARRHRPLPRGTVRSDGRHGFVRELEAADEWLRRSPSRWVGWHQRVEAALTRRRARFPSVTLAKVLQLARLVNEPYESLLARAKSAEPNVAVDAIRALGALGDSRAGAPLVALLKATTDHGIRSTTAIALHDLAADVALAPLVELIEDPKTRGYRGSLVAALRAFDCGPYLDKLVDWVVEGNFEVSHEAFMVIEELESTMTLESVEAARNKVRDAQAQIHPAEKRALLDDLLELLSETRDGIHERP